MAGTIAPSVRKASASRSLPAERGHCIVGGMTGSTPAGEPGHSGAGAGHGMTAGSFRDKGRTMMALALSMLSMAFAVAAAEPEPASAEPPVFGAWRNLQTEAGFVPAQRNLAFGMLPQAASRGDRFAILDREGKRTVCCLQV